MLGKTNMDEFAMGSSNENSGFGPVQQPVGPRRACRAAPRAAAPPRSRPALAPWAIGTDTGGSIRQPASLCGIVGLKPTYGAVSRYGMIAFASSLDQCGPLTRDVTDAALLLRAHGRARDPCDSTSLGYPDEIALPSARAPRRPALRRPRSSGRARASSRAWRRSLERTLGEIEELGGDRGGDRAAARRHGISAYYVIAPAEASANLARYDGVRYGIAAPATATCRRSTRRPAREGFGAEVKRRIMLGTYALSSGYYEAYYGTAQKVRTQDRRRLQGGVREGRLRRHAHVADGRLQARRARPTNPLAMYLSDYFTVPMSLAGIPAISIPRGLSDGLPVGLQIAGPAFSESRILDASYALERALGFEGSGAA